MFCSNWHLIIFELCSFDTFFVSEVGKLYRIGECKRTFILSFNLRVSPLSNICSILEEGVTVVAKININFLTLFGILGGKVVIT